MPPLGLPVTNGLVLAICPFTGSLRDFSGNERHPVYTSTGAKWVQRNGADQLLVEGFARLVVANDTGLEAITDNSLFISSTSFGGAKARRLFSKRDVGGIHLEVYTDTPTRFRMSSGGGTIISLDPGAALTSARSAAMTTKSGQSPLLYLDGAFNAAFSGPLTINSDDADLVLFNVYNGTIPARDSSRALLWYSRVLSAPEIAQLHTWSQSRFTPRKQWPGGGLRYPGRGDPYTPATGDPMFIDNIQTARVTLANEASGKFSNTTFDISSGTFSLREDDTGRYIYCVGAGKLRQRLLGADTYTTALFTETGGATITKDATGFDLDFGAGDIVRAVQLTAP